jgi:hypothetical protein
MKSLKYFFSQLICQLLTAGLALFLVGASASAQEYNFNNQGAVKPEFDKKVEFKTTDGPQEKPDLVGEAVTSTPHLYKVTLGYPKKEFIASWNPGAMGFKYDLTAVRSFNTTGTNVSNFSAGYRFNTSPEDYFQFDANVFQTAVPDYTDSVAGGLSIKKSSATLFSFAFSGTVFCKIYDDALHKLCPGYRFGYDSFPTLTFPENSTSNTQIELTTAKDITVGAFLDYAKPVSGTTQLITKLAYNRGLGVGQSSTLSLKSNDKYSAAIGAEWPAQKGSMYYSVLGGGDYRLAKLKNNTDEWNITHINYYVALGLRWEWGSPVK